MDHLLQLCYYHELSYYTNTYSLSTIDNIAKRCCILCTSKQIFRLIARKLGEVKLQQINLWKSHLSGDSEIQTQSLVFHKEFLYMSIINHHRRDHSNFFTLISIRFRSEDLDTAEPYTTLDLDYVPHKMFLV
jgi:hypothetical protein